MVLNKNELLDSEEESELLFELKKKTGKIVISTSAVMKKGLSELLSFVWKELDGQVDLLWVPYSYLSEEQFLAINKMID